ncbi:metabolite traffic protein EboE [Streptomyces cellulosae]|jgi:sugar phosphate isomerase/epimerase|uniref:Sugar phosphate isomerase/epimerase n=1 Tax=Streptomyces thermodiastaticus TaxID=44061 RepID=A0ABU0K804_9ACTN|nr:metabolite traffic protein EboE [Streptomyces sp. McG8]MCX4481411.1 metabolite traffic protein EboE [Streptomyces cellulosae]MDQ0485490.1 sugar phosphate isomerase/epimerase [Streptomyces thermodiastaticus]MXQ57097.1 metabolite traffic protein EboE [Streptomyces sp. XHT-2]MYW52641.1 metabolite traffic protein EboE [Streptomyces sp. SID8376]UVT12724.1 metabolite traffic protein EboE [Streptomyces thermocarboxydus]
MRFRHPDGSTVHLAYCTNVHPAETLDGVLAQLRDHCEPVRRRLGRDRLGIGLWLAKDAARALVTDPAALRNLRCELERRGLEVVTLNGFPYEGFGAEEVKYRVYKPDWADPERLEHTAALARVLAGLLPDDVTEGSISTLPLAWRTAYDDERAESARTALRTLAERLDALEELTGRSVRVALEPEPGCVVETTRDAIAPLTAVGHDRIGICVDTCHLATSFEEPGTALDDLARAGVPVVKSQLSAALHAEQPHLPEVREALAAFAEPRFLHQTRTRTAAGLRGTDDLDEALTGDALPDAGPWRSHFHVPLHAAPAAPLTSTLPVLTSVLTRLVGGPHPLTRHLEVETYTWQALPPELRPRGRAQLADGIAAELTLARDLLTDLGLKELP